MHNMAAGPSSGPPLASACLGAGGLPASPVLACRWADSVVTDTDRVAGNLRLHLGGPVGAGLEDRRVGEGCGGGLWRRVGGGFEEGWRRVGGGLEDELWRRRVGGGLEEGLRTVGGGWERQGWRRVGGQGWRRAAGQCGCALVKGQLGVTKGEPPRARGSSQGYGWGSYCSYHHPASACSSSLGGRAVKRQQLGWDIAQM